MTGEIKCEQHDSIVTITISRPDKLNSVTREMLIDFDEKISKFANDPNIVAIVFTGEGEKAFCAGFDLKMIKGLSDDEYTDFFKELEKTIRVIKQARNCITIAAVNGHAIGFGAMVSNACDFRFYSKNASFSLPEITIDIFPGAGAASSLIHLVGPAKSKDLLLTGRRIPAEEAFRIGIADRLFEPEELLDKTLEFVKDIVEKNRLILLRTKSLIDGMTGKSVDSADELECTYLDEWLREHRK
ncbi:MAG: enoyl-CoA hydratase/isomerase family protein [Candidatus Thorarchaeota archaeon]